MLAVRVGLPVGIAIAGVVLIIVGNGRVHGEGPGDVLGGTDAGLGVSLLIAAIIVWMLGWMFRMSVESNRDRESEEDARRYFDEHGRWPDEEAQ
jgi:predicted transporter